MSNVSQLPPWVFYLQALAVPIFAALGVWIAARQMLIANDKLRLDFFDRQYERRIALYEATRGILEQVFRETLTEADTRTYGLRALDAQFLFDTQMYKYLRDVHHHVEALRDARSAIESNIPNAERREYDKIATAQMDWIIKQGDEHTGIGAKFAPFLVHSSPKRPWLLRWP